jgi:hypothetical protein
MARAIEIGTFRDISEIFRSEKRIANKNRRKQVKTNKFFKIERVILFGTFLDNSEEY